MQSLYHACLHGGATFVTEGTFHRLLPPLVAQLGRQVPPEVHSQLSALDADVVPAGQATVYGVPQEQGLVLETPVAVLVQLAVAANTDLLWKPLNHQVGLPCSQHEFLGHCLIGCRAHHVPAGKPSCTPTLGSCRLHLPTLLWPGLCGPCVAPLRPIVFTIRTATLVF